MFNKQITACLEQKVILLTKIMDLTKQIEIRCMEPDIQLDHFMDDRESFMKRVDKCDVMIRNQIQLLSDEEQAKTNQILSLAVSEADLSEEELKAFQLQQKCNLLFQRAASLNRSAMQAMESQYDEVKKKIKQLRKPKNNDGLFLPH